MSLHLFVGEEDLLIEEGVRGLLDTLLPPHSRDLNLDVLDAGEVDTGDILTRLDTLPFFGDRRVVVLRNVDTLGPGDVRALEGYLERGLPPTDAIFTARALDRRGRLFKTIDRLGVVHGCNPLPAREAPTWAQRQAERLGKRLGSAAAQALVARSGVGLRDLRGEIEKLASYVGERPEITPRDVEESASHLGEIRGWELMDAVGERNTARAMQVLTGLLASEHPLVVLAMIATQFRRLLRTRAVAGRSRDEVARAAGVPPWLVPKLLRQASRYRPEAFAAIFTLLEEADRAVKSTGQPELALEALVVELCAG